MDRFLESNAILRILALVLACVLWLGVNGQNLDGVTAVSAKFPFPVRVEAGPGMVVTHISSPSAVILVSGNIANEPEFPAQMLGVAVVANAKGLSPGEHTVRLAAVNMPPVSYRIQPEQVQIRLERRVTVQMPVRVRVIGHPASGYFAGTPRADIRSVEVSGTRSAIAQVAAVEAPVSVADAREDVTKSVTLLPVTAQGDPVAGVELNPSALIVTVPIAAPSLRVPVVADVVGSPAPGYAVAGVRVQPSAVTVLGVPKTTSRTVHVPVDVTGLRTSRTLAAPVPLTAGTEAVQPPDVEVTVDVEPSGMRQMSDVPIQIVHMVPGEQVELPGPQRVSVGLAGPQTILAHLRPQDIRVTIDANKLSPGSASAPVDVSVPKWVQVIKLSVSTVPVRVTMSPGQ